MRVFVYILLSIFQYDHMTLTVNRPDVKRFIAYIEPPDWIPWIRQICEDADDYVKTGEAVICWCHTQSIFRLLSAGVLKVSAFSRLSAHSLTSCYPASTHSNLTLFQSANDSLQRLPVLCNNLSRLNWTRCVV